MLLKRASFGFLICLVSLFAAQSVKAGYFERGPESQGLILISDGGIGQATSSLSGAPAAIGSNPVTYVPNAVGANWVFQFDLSTLPAANDILSVVFNVIMEGNTDPALKFGVGHGVADSHVAARDTMSPGLLETFTALDLDYEFELDVTSAVKAAKDAHANYYRFALTANPKSTSFASASFHDPFLKVEAVPEPSTLACFGIGVIVLGARRVWRRR